MRNACGNEAKDDPIGADEAEPKDKVHGQNPVMEEKPAQDSKETATTTMPSACAEGETTKETASVFHGDHAGTGESNCEQKKVPEMGPADVVEDRKAQETCVTEGKAEKGEVSCDSKEESEKEASKVRDACGNEAKDNPIGADEAEPGDEVHGQNDLSDI